MSFETLSTRFEECGRLALLPGITLSIFILLIKTARHSSTLPSSSTRNGFPSGLRVSLGFSHAPRPRPSLGPAFVGRHKEINMAQATPTRRALVDLPVNTFGTPSALSNPGKGTPSHKRTVDAVSEPEYPRLKSPVKVLHTDPQKGRKDEMEVSQCRSRS